jgi:homoserine kinase
LGSSSTAIVAGLLAGNQLLGNPYTKAALLETAISLEGHPDNVSPAMLGGFVFGDTRQQQSIAWPANWEVFTISPPYPVSTASARQALPPSVSMESAVFNLRKASLLIHALHTQNMQLFSESLTDQLHQPYRGLLIPEFQILKGAMLQTTALGTIISGSGSTMAVFFETQHKQVLTAVLNDLFHAQGWKNFDMQASTVDPMGAGIF